MIEISITLKDSERTLTKKFLDYSHLQFSRGNEELIKMVEEVSREFKGDVDLESPDITIKAKMIW